MGYLIILAFGQVIVAIYLLWKDFRQNKAERFLLYYIIILGLYLITKFVSNEFYKDHNLFNELSTPLNLVCGPLLYFFVKFKS